MSATAKYRETGHLRFSRPAPVAADEGARAITAALRQMAKSKQQITITVVPVVSAANELCDTKNVFRCQRMRFLTYNG